MAREKEDLRENPLFRIYCRFLPALAAAIVVVVVLVRLITAIFGPKQLVLEVNYKDYEQGATIQSPMRAASDEAFENELTYVKKKKSGFFNSFDFFQSEEEKVEETETGFYTFTYEADEIPDTIYVKSPEWWCPVDTNGAMVLPAEEGAETEPVTESGAFKIKEIETVKILTGVFNVNVTISSTMDAVPSDVKLMMDGYEFDEWDGSSEVTYDEVGGFAERTLVFRFNRGSHEDISDLFADAKIIIDEYTVLKKYTDCDIKANADGLQIQVREE